MFRLSEAKACLTDLVRRAEAGDEVVLTRHGRPVVRLAPVAGAPAKFRYSTGASRLSGCGYLGNA